MGFRLGFKNNTKTQKSRLSFKAQSPCQQLLTVEITKADSTRVEETSVASIGGVRIEVASDYEESFIHGITLANQVRVLRAQRRLQPLKSHFVFSTLCLCSTEERNLNLFGVVCRIDEHFLPLLFTHCTMFLQNKIQLKN